MTEFSDQFARLSRQGRDLLTRVRPHHLGMLAGVAVIGVGAMAVAAMARPGRPALSGGERLQIEVVAPVEPAVSPGPVMEVGHLVDGMVSPPAPPPPVEPLHDAYYEEGPEAVKPPSRSKRSVEDAIIQAPLQPEDPQRDRRRDQEGRWFGFDGPQRDYRAEREARRARMEARTEREREAREIRRYRSDGRTGDYGRREGDPWPDRGD